MGKFRDSMTSRRLLLAVFLTAAASVAGAQGSSAKPKASIKAVSSKTSAANKTGLKKSTLASLADRGSNPRGPFAKVSSEQRDSLGEHARQLLGTRYKWAGANPARGLDCSGFVKYVFASLGVELPHSAKELAKLGGSITKDTSDMQPGDLLVFGKGKRISHVGIYIGDGIMIHASSSNKSVVETPMDKYRPAGGLQWKGVRRVISVPSTGTDGDGPENR